MQRGQDSRARVTQRKRRRGLYLLLASVGLGLLQGCDSGSTSEAQQNPSSAAQQTPASSAEAIPHFEATPRRAKYSVARCNKKACAEIEIYTLRSADPWFDQWLSGHLAQVIQQQVAVPVAANKPLSLQQAVNVYAKHSAAWQHEFVQNQAYTLQLNSSIAAQHWPYVLLQVAVDSEQGDRSVKQRLYFDVLNLQSKQHLALGDVIAPAQHTAMDQWLQQQYQHWLKDQTKAVQITAAKKLSWKNVDWFFDQEGIGLHYRANEIVADSASLDIYLSKAQTQAWLKPSVYAQMFAAPSGLKTDTKLD